MIICPFFRGSSHAHRPFKEHFQDITDQRQGAKVTYCLFEVLFGLLCAVIAGAKECFDFREYILGHHEWFKRNGLFINDIPADVIRTSSLDTELSEYNH